tara:strand:- start:284 stop:511 length:228 start_codon:yes stop_codon:yes gene_type:complete
MSKISNEGLSQIQVIKNALDSMFDKLESADLYEKSSGKVKNIEEAYKKSNTIGIVQDEFETIAGIVSEAQTWEEA